MLLGSGDWQEVTYDLGPILAGATTFQLRFRLTSDYSLNKDGWKIDKIGVFYPIN